MPWVTGEPDSAGRIEVIHSPWFKYGIHGWLKGSPTDPAGRCQDTINQKPCSRLRRGQDFCPPYSVIVCWLGYYTPEGISLSSTLIVPHFPTAQPVHKSRSA
jgi:hypothetical protein